MPDKDWLKSRSSRSRRLGTPTETETTDFFYEIASTIDRKGTILSFSVSNVHVFDALKESIELGLTSMHMCD